jgi:DNA-binding response OmpR family regulator
MTTRILMVETDACLVSAVSRALAEYAVILSSVASFDEAVEVLRGEVFALAIVESTLVSATDLKHFSGMPIVVTASFLEPEPARRLARHARLLRKPFTSAELTQVLTEEIGLTVMEHSLLDVLSRAHNTRRSLELRVGEGELVLEDGEVVHAALAEMCGEAALVEILAGGGRLVHGPSQSAARTINRPFQALLLDALRHVEAKEGQRGPAFRRSGVVRVPRRTER